VGFSPGPFYSFNNFPDFQPFQPEHRALRDNLSKCASGASNFGISFTFLSGT
jgi:hypothetical protein